MTESPITTPIAPAMRVFLIGATALVALAAFPLFFLSEQTDQFFAWTIQPPISAAFLGSGYWAVTLAVGLALREHEWARIRIGAATVVTGVVFILIATLLHLDRFHLSSTIFTALAEAWAWLVLYIILIPALIIALSQQRRMPGVDAPRQSTLPRWLQIAMLAQSLIMLLLGLGLFILPAQVAPIWAWQLTPLVSRMIGSWLIAIGVSLLVAVRENDYTRIHMAAVAYVTYAVLQFVNLIRYPAMLNWAQPNAWLLIVILMGLLIIGVVSLRGYFVHRVSRAK